MKKLTYKHYLAGLLFFGSMASCKSDFLDRRPEDTIVDANFYQTADQVLAGTAPLYNQVWFSYNDKASHGLGDARGGVLYSGSYQIENTEMRTTATTSEVQTAWQSFFNIIGQSNLLINNIEKYAAASVPDNIKQHAIAEARFMRGLAYSYLVQNWGPVPIITNNNTLLQDTTLPRNTVESVWQFIIRDISFAANTLPATPVQVGRLHKWAAEGMLAKMYLTRAGVGASNGSRNQSDLDSAKYFSKRVIDNSGASLMRDYEELFMTKNNNNPESLFALQWKYDGTWGAQNSVQAFLAFGSSITGFSDGWGGDIGASKYIMDQYDPNDKRRKATFMYPGDHYSYIHQDVGGGVIKELDVPVQSKDPDTGDPYNSRAWVKKYVVGRPEDNSGKVQQQRTEINTYMLRLADVYLIYADAVLGNNTSTSDPLALQYFNAVRSRANLSTKTSITYDDIFNERFLEFAMEGQAWYDLVRLFYFNPTKALDIIARQDRGAYRVYPDRTVGATSWEVRADPADNSRFFPVTAANFFLPIPSTEMTKAPNLNKPPVPYQF